VDAVRRTASSAEVAPTRVVIDTDPGVDDAVALALALASPELEVVGVTTVAGNAPLETTTRNALRLLELAGAPSVPVSPGADRPLVHAAPHESESVHGKDGLWEVLPFEPALEPGAVHAVELLASSVAAGPLTVVAIGPLTNIALLLAMRPGVAAEIERLSIMGGARLEGNVTGAAEFNIWADPEAAARVLDSGLAITLLPLDVTHQAWLTQPELDALGSTAPVGVALAEMVRRYASVHDPRDASPYGPLHDPLAVIAVCMPELIAFEEATVVVDTGFSPSRGATIVTTRAPAESASAGDSLPVLVGTVLDRDGFASVLIERIRALDLQIEG